MNFFDKKKEVLYDKNGGCMEIFQYFLLFILYSILGWAIEVICCAMISKRFINRGFLLGPYCPIYGTTAIIMILFLKKYIEDPLVLFIMSCVLATFIEYVTSYIMEVLFKARWWDYSEKKYNINGRVCLENAFLFGVLGIFLMYFINPFFMSLLSKFSRMFSIILAIFLFIIYIVDNIISFKVIMGAKNTINRELKDSTELFKEKVIEAIQKKSKKGRRLISAFPSLKIYHKENKK